MDQGYSAKMHSDSKLLRAESTKTGSRNGAAAVGASQIALDANEGEWGFEHLKARQKQLRAIFGKTTKSPFLWSVAHADEHELTVRLQILHKSFWSGSTDQLTNPVFHIDHVAQSDRFETIHSDSSDFSKLPSPAVQSALLQVAHSAYDLPTRIQQERSEGSDGRELGISSDPILQQLLSVELPLWEQLSCDVSSGDKIGAKLEFESMISDSLDQNGWIEGHAIEDWGLFAASCCRTDQLLRKMNLQVDPIVADQLSQLAEQLLRNSRKDGSLLHGESGGGFNCNAFRKMVSQNWAHGYCRQRLSRKAKASGRLPAQSSISEWAQAGVLRKSWKSGGGKVGFAFDSKQIRLDIDNGSTLVRGTCSPQLAINGEPLRSTDEIGVSCFLRFDGGEYTELELECGAWKLQRQILLLADDLLFLSDNLIGSESAEIEYRCRFPLGDGQQIVKESETNEFYLRRDDKYCLVLPLALPEWKTEKRNGNVEIRQHDFEMVMKQRGRGVSVPLVFDLNPKRSVKPRTWRRLTVAEQMEIVSPDVAVAYRVQIARKQWLFYRSLAQPGNRTFLGENFADDFFVGSINVNGTVKTLLEVER